MAKNSFKIYNLEDYEIYFEDHWDDPHYFIVQNFPEYFSLTKFGIQL